MNTFICGHCGSSSSYLYDSFLVRKLAIYQSNTSLLGTALFKTGNDSGGFGGRIKCKECHCLVIQSQLPGVVSCKDKDWLLKGYLLLSGTIRQKLKASEVTGSFPTAQTPALTTAAPPFHSSWPTFHLGHMVPSWLNGHLFPGLFSYFSSTAHFSHLVLNHDLFFVNYLVHLCSPMT